MRAYDVATADGAMKVVIFAKTEDAAVGMFCDLYLARYGAMPDEFHTERRTLQAESDPAALRTALRLGQSGLATLSASVWSIKPIPSVDAAC